MIQQKSLKILNFFLCTQNVSVSPVPKEMLEDLRPENRLVVALGPSHPGPPNLGGGIL